MCDQQDSQCVRIASLVGHMAFFPHVLKQYKDYLIDVTKKLYTVDTEFFGTTNLYLCF